MTIHGLRRAVAGASTILAVAALALAAALWWSLAHNDAREAPRHQPPKVTTVVTTP